jgi:hypothetical protein
MIHRFATTALAVAALFTAGAALAQPAGNGGGGMRQACQADFEKFCADVQPGGGARIRCLRQHAADLSDACKAAFAARQKAHDSQPAGQGGNAGQ